MANNQRSKKIKEKPKCYRPNLDAYPFCLGTEHPVDFAEFDCINCSLYENQINESGGYYDN